MGDESPQAPAYSPPRDDPPTINLTPSIAGSTAAALSSPLKRPRSPLSSTNNNDNDDAKRRRVDDATSGVKTEDNGNGGDSPDSIKDEINTPTPMKKEETDEASPPSSSAPRASFDDDKTAAANAAFVDGEDGDGATPEEAQREEEAAIACGLTSFMSQEEAESVAGAADDPDSYLQIRNILCDLWQQDVTGFVAPRILSDKFVDKHLTLARATFQYLEQFGYINCGLTNRDPNKHRRPQSIIVIGAGASGLMAARQLHNFGHHVTVLEGRNRVGGRVCTETNKFSGPVELGASIVNGWVRNPITVLGRQIEARAQKRSADAPWTTTSDADQQKNPLPNTFHALMSECPIYDLSGRKLADDIDADMQQLWDTLLDGCETMRAPVRAAQVTAAAEAAALGITAATATGNGTPRSSSLAGASAAATASSSITSSPVATKSEPTPATAGATSLSSTPSSSSTGDVTTVIHDTHGDGLIRRPSVDVKTPAGLDMNQVNLDQGTRITREQIVEGRGRALSKQEECTLNWHRANLEYANATPLDKLSILNWDQDDGLEWTGVHTLIKPGYGSIMKALTVDLVVKLEQNVAKIVYHDTGVTVTTTDDNIYKADIVVVTLPLGVLKAKSVTFEPPLPSWKTDAIDRLGFGLLNKLVMEFDDAWWKDRPEVDMFGILIDDPVNYGRFFQFWNIERVINKPVLVALVAGNAAHSFEQEDESKSVRDCLQVLRRVWPAAPDPIITHCTRWRADPFARGSYSYIPPGATGEDYDLIQRPIGRRVFFAGEGTNRKNPATVPGAILTGLRVAGTIELEGPHARGGTAGSSIAPKLPRFTRNVDLAALTERLRRNRARHQRPHAVSAPLPVVSEDELQREKSAQLAMRARLDNEMDQLLSGPKDILAIPLGSDTNDGRTTSGGIPGRFVRTEKDNPFGAKAANLGDLPTVLSFADFDTSRNAASSHHRSSGHRRLSSSSSSRSSVKKRSSVRRRKDDKKRPSSSSSSSRKSSSDEKRSAPSTTDGTVPSSSSNGGIVKKEKKKKDGSKKKGDKKSSKKKGGSDDATKKIAVYIRHLLKDKLGHPKDDDARNNFKSVAKKAVERVSADWTGKKRSVTVDAWLTEKKTKISLLIDTYAPRFGITANGSSSSSAASAPLSSPSQSSSSSRPMPSPSPPLSSPHPSSSPSASSYRGSSGSGASLLSSPPPPSSSYHPSQHSHQQHASPYGQHHAHHQRQPQMQQRGPPPYLPPYNNHNAAPLNNRGAPLLPSPHNANANTGRGAPPPPPAPYNPYGSSSSSSYNDNSSSSSSSSSSSRYSGTSSSNNSHHNGGSSRGGDDRRYSSGSSSSSSSSSSRR